MTQRTPSERANSTAGEYPSHGLNTPVEASSPTMTLEGLGNTSPVASAMNEAMARSRRTPTLGCLLGKD